MNEDQRKEEKAYEYLLDVIKKTINNYKEITGKDSYNLHKLYYDFKYGYVLSDESLNHIKQTLKETIEEQEEGMIDEFIAVTKEENQKNLEAKTLRTQEKQYLLNELNKLVELTKNSSSQDDKLINMRANSAIKRIRTEEIEKDNLRNNIYKLLYENRERINKKSDTINTEQEKQKNETEAQRKQQKEKTQENVKDTSKEITLNSLLTKIQESLRRGIPAENTTYNMIYSIQHKKELNHKDISSIKRIVEYYKNQAKISITEVELNKLINNSINKNNKNKEKKEEEQAEVIINTPKNNPNEKRKITGIGKNRKYQREKGIRKKIKNFLKRRIKKQEDLSNEEENELSTPKRR